MAKNRKAASGSSSYNKKKIETTSGKKPAKKTVQKLDNKKAEIISEKLTKINTNFESLIAECQKALKQLTTH